VVQLVKKWGGEREAYLAFYVGECLKILVVGQSNGSFWEKKNRPVTNDKYPQFIMA